MTEGLLDFFKNDRFAAMSGAELTEVGSGYAKARLLVGDCHLNGAGICQGGAVFTLADLAFAAAVNSHGQVTVSVTANITFCHAAKKGWLYAEAREIVNHPRLPYVEVTVTDQEANIIAVMTSSGLKAPCFHIQASMSDKRRKIFVANKFHVVQNDGFACAFGIVCPENQNAFSIDKK